MMTSNTPNTPNTRPSSPRSNASTPRGDRDYEFENLDLGLLRSLPNTPRPGTPRPGTPRTGTPPPLRGGNGKSTNRKGKQLRRYTRRRVHRKASNRHTTQHSSRLRRRNNLT